MFYVFLVMDTRLYTLLCWSVGRSIRNIFEFRAVFALLLLPNHPRLDCRVSGLIVFSSMFEKQGQIHTAGTIFEFTRLFGQEQ